MDSGERLSLLKKYAESLIAEYGLSGWTFSWNRRRSKMGLTFFPMGHLPGRIELSIYHAQGSEFDEVDDTIRHEIAHGIAGQDAGHGPRWKEACGVTGANPERIGHGPFVRGLLVTKCPSCGQEYTKFRMPKNGLERWYCPKSTCGVQKGPLVWQRTDVVCEAQ